MWPFFDDMKRGKLEVPQAWIVSESKTTPPRGNTKAKNDTHTHLIERHRQTFSFLFGFASWLLASCFEKVRQAWIVSESKTTPPRDNAKRKTTHVYTLRETQTFLSFALTTFALPLAFWQKGYEGLCPCFIYIIISISPQSISLPSNRGNMHEMERGHLSRGPKLTKGTCVRWNRGS